MSKVEWFSYPESIESLIPQARIDVEHGHWVKTPDAKPRQPRIDLPRMPQHRPQRGNDRRPCFLAPIDRTRYFDELRDAAARISCDVRGHVLMTKHAHLLGIPAAPDCVSAMMRSLGRRYVRCINDRYRRTGTLWEGRFKACPVQSDDHLLPSLHQTQPRPRPQGRPSRRRRLVKRCRKLAERDRPARQQTRSTWRWMPKTRRANASTATGPNRPSRRRKSTRSGNACSASTPSEPSASNVDQGAAAAPSGARKDRRASDVDSPSGGGKCTPTRVSLSAVLLSQHRGEPSLRWRGTRR